MGGARRTPDLHDVVLLLLGPEMRIGEALALDRPSPCWQGTRFGPLRPGPHGIYWSLGGTWHVWSSGSNLQASFQGWEWMLAPIGLAKLIAALAPVVLARRGWLAGRRSRARHAGSAPWC